MSQKKSSRKALANFLQAIAKGEREIEFLRQRLCENEEFEIYTAFQRIKKDPHKKTLSVKDFHFFLLSADRSIFERDLEKLIRHYDMDNDGEINFSEFLRIVLPRDNPYLRTVVSQRPIIKPSSSSPIRLSSKVDIDLICLISQEIKFLQNLETQLRFHNSEPFEKMTALNIFLVTGARSSGCLDFDLIDAFFRSLAIFPYEEDIISILRRIDRVNEGKIVIEDLRSFLALLEMDTYPRADAEGKRNLLSQGEKLRSFTPESSAQKRKERLVNSTVKRRNMEGDENFTRGRADKAIPFYRSTDLKSFDCYPYKTKQMNESSSDFGTRTLWSTNFTNKYKINENAGTPERDSLAESGAMRTAEFILSGEKSSASADKKSRNERSRKTAMIVNFFKKIASLDQEVERAKQELALKTDFNVLDCFKVFDRNNQGTITSNEMEEALIDIGVPTAHNDLLLLFIRFDGDGDGKMRYTDFMPMLTPRLNEFSELLLNRETSDVEFTSPTKIFSPLTIASLANLFQKHIKIENEIEEYRKSLIANISSEEFEDIFKDLDGNQIGNMTTRELEKIFQSYNLPMIRRDISAIMDRFDSNRDGKISFTEFLEEISPKIPSGFN